MSLDVNKLTTPTVKVVNFQGENKTKEDVIQNEAPQQDNSKLYLSLAGLATIGLGTLATVVGYRKGIAKGKTIGQAEGLIKGELDTLKSLTTISFKDFKKIGQFDKAGVATVDGKPFSGKITRPCRGGETVVTYKDGLKQEAIIPQWRGTTKRRVYNHKDSYFRDLNSQNQEFYTLYKAKDGSIIKEFPYNRDDIKIGNYTERSSQEFWVHKPDGTFMKCKKSFGELSHPNYKGGKPIKVGKVVDLNTGKNIELHKDKELALYDERVRKHVIVDGKKVTVHYDNWGNEFSYAHTSEFDPKTGLTTKQYYELDESGKLIPTNRYSIKDVKKTGAYLSYKVDAKGQKYDIMLDDSQNGDIKSNIYDGRRYWTDLEQIKENIKRLGVAFPL